MLTYLLQTTAPVPVDSSWSPGNVILVISAIVAGALSIIAAIKSFQSNTIATNADARTTRLNTRIDNTNARVDQVALMTPPPPPTTSPPGPRHIPVLLTLFLLPAVLAVGGCSLLPGYSSAERKQYEIFRDGMWENTSLMRTEFPLLARSVAGDNNADGQITPEDGPVRPHPVSSLSPAQRQAWLRPMLEQVDQLTKWHDESQAYDAGTGGVP